MLRMTTGRMGVCSHTVSVFALIGTNMFSINTADIKNANKHLFISDIPLSIAFLKFLVLRKYYILLSHNSQGFFLLLCSAGLVFCGIQLLVDFIPKTIIHQ